MQLAERKRRRAGLSAVCKRVRLDRCEGQSCELIFRIAMERTVEE